MKAFLLIYFLSLSFLNAQQLDKEKFDKGVDFVTCICINNASKKEIVDCKKAKIERKDISDGKTIALFDELQSLKKETKKNANFLSKDIFENEKKYQKIHAFAERRKGKELDSIKLKIEFFLEAEDVEITQSDPAEDSIGSAIPDETATSVTIISPIEETKQQPIMETSFLEENSISLILFVILIVLIIYILLEFSSLKKKINTANRKSDKEFKSENSLFSKQNIENRNISNLENKIQTLSTKISELENNIEKISNSVNIERTVLTDIPLKKEEAVNEVFYMAVPNEDGSFDNGGRIRKEAALYEFVVDAKNPTLAKFSFFARDIKIIQSVVDYSQSYINPVCEPQNALNQNAKQITTVRHGIAEKRNDKWVITSKAQIKYE